MRLIEYGIILSALLSHSLARSHVQGLKGLLHRCRHADEGKIPSKCDCTPTHTTVYDIPNCE